jgi:hypothetical protein
MPEATAPVLPRCPVCGWEYEGQLPGFCGRPGCGVELLPGTAERPGIRTFTLLGHFSMCVLPFSFTETEDSPICQRLQSGGRWQERVFSLDDPDDVERTEYFLPYIRRFLFPSLFAKEPVQEGKPGKGARSCWHFKFDLKRLGPAGAEGLPLTLRGHDARKNLSATFPLLLEEVQLIVFSYRVGFLVLRFRSPGASGATFFDQMDALSYLRMIAPAFRGFRMPELLVGERRFLMTQLLPYLLAEFDTATPPPASPSDTPADRALPVRPIYDDRMMIYTFSCLDKDTVLESAPTNIDLLRRASIVNLDEKGTTRPHGEERSRDPRAWIRSRWNGFSKDGGSVAVFNTDRYHARFLGVYTATYYFDIFLLAALQRVTLLMLFEGFADIQTLITGTNAGRKLLRRVRRDLLMFKNQCWFSQITNRERGLILWKKWQRTFETPALLREVNEQSEELNTYLQMRYRERMEWLVRLGSFLAASLPFILSLERFLGHAPWVETLRWVLLTVVVVGAGAFAWWVFFRQPDEV